MANAVFNSTESYFSDFKPNANVSRSVFDLSCIRTFDTDFGALIPFYLLDCLPNDSFDFSCVVKSTCIPLLTPLYTNIKISTAFFYVPYYLLWRHFDRFISGGKNGSYVAELPTICDPSDPDGNVTFAPNSLGDYFGFPVNVPLKGVSAFPFAAYQRIYRDYFLNQDMQLPFIDGSPSNDNDWLPEDDFDFVLKDGSHSCFGPSIGKTFNVSLPFLNVIRFKNWRKDYFTSSMYSPQRGPTPALPVTGTVNIDVRPKTPAQVGVGSSEISPLVTDSGTPYLVDPSSGAPYNRLYSALENSVVANFTNQVGFTIDDLRLAMQVSEWLERNMRVKAQYNEFLRIHFNDAPIDERLTKPYYIGGTVQDLVVSEVLQMSESTDTSAQGTPTGHARSFDSQHVGTFHSHEYGLIIGLMYIMPDTTYTQGIDRHWTKKDKFDFYFPEFAQLSPQAILNKEIFATGTSVDDEVFGYIGRMDEYRHMRSMAVGSLRNPLTEDFYSWTMSREFSSTPTLNSNAFLSSNGRLGESTIPSVNTTIRHDAFAVSTVNPFIVQAGVQCRAVRPLPYVNVPKGLL